MANGREYQAGDVVYYQPPDAEVGPVRLQVLGQMTGVSAENPEGTPALNCRRLDRADLSGNWLFSVLSDRVADTPAGAIRLAAAALRTRAAWLELQAVQPHWQEAAPPPVGKSDYGA